MPRPKVGDERREAIFAALEFCIVNKGLAATTLMDVADAAKLPRPLVRYFIGNRSQMIDALLERLLEQSETRLRDLPRCDDIGHIPDLLLDHVFSDQTTNIVIMELWHLSLRDERLRVRLAAIYERLVTEIATLASDHSDGGNGDDRAFAAVSLAFGTAFFRHLGLEPVARQNLRDATSRLLTPSPNLTQAGD